VVYGGYILDHIPDDLGKGLVSPSHKFAGIDGVIEKKRLVSTGLLQHLQMKGYLIGWLHKRGIYIQASLVSRIGLQATIMDSDPRFVIRLTDSICHFYRGCLLEKYRVYFEFVPS